MPHRSIGVQVASKCRGARRKLPSAAASQHKVSTVKPTTNKFNMTQRERETAPSKFNSRFIRRFGVCSGLSRCSAAGALDATRAHSSTKCDAAAQECKAHTKLVKICDIPGFLTPTFKPGQHETARFCPYTSHTHMSHPQHHITDTVTHTIGTLHSVHTTHDRSAFFRPRVVFPCQRSVGGGQESAGSAAHMPCFLHSTTAAR